MSRVLASVVPASNVVRDSVLLLVNALLAILTRYHWPVVPDSTGVRSPLESNLNIDILLVNIEKVVQDGITLRLIQANNLVAHRPVDKERLPSGSRVRPNNGMDPLNVLGPLLWVVAVEVRVRRPEDSLLAIDDLAETR